MKNVDIIGKLSTENLNGEILTFNFNEPVVSDLFHLCNDNFLYIDDLNPAQIKFVTYLCYNSYIEINKDVFCYIEGDSFIEKLNDISRTCTLVAILKNDSGKLEKAIFMDDK